MSRESPIVIAYVSGKGGVGKTMLAVAAATELSSSNRTLLIDLDFFNRGLTGLMRQGKEVCRISRPSFLEGTAATSEKGWSLIQIAPNLFHISYPDLSSEELQQFESCDVVLMRDSLKEFITDVSNRGNCNCVVLDCHGGPDHSSFAACLAADYSILVSEPDKITFYGTLHFIRQLERVSQGSPYALRLVFNKVIPAFSPFFLRNLYNRELRPALRGLPLLAMYPLEIYLTKEFQRTPLLTRVYPDSLLARKTSVLIYDLLYSTHRSMLSPSTRSLPRLVRSYRRISMGKRSFLADLNGVLVLLGVVLLGFYALSTYMKDEYYRIVSLLGISFSRFGDYLFLPAITWVLSIIVINVSRALDLRFTYSSRKQNYASALLFFLAAIFVWTFPTLVLHDLAREASRLKFSTVLGPILPIDGILLAVLLLVVSVQLFRAYRYLRYERRYFESSLRILFCAFPVGGLFAGLVTRGSNWLR